MLNEDVLREALSRKASPKYVPSVAVIKTSRSDDWDKRLREFGERASGRLYGVLAAENVQVLGVGWGATVASTVTGLLSLNTPALQRPVWCIPTCGEALGLERLVWSSSGLAKNLDEAINASLDHHLSLAGVPAVIPIDIEDDIQRVLFEKLICRATQYREVFVEMTDRHQQAFQGKPPFAERLDVVLTSLASPKQPWRMFPVEQEASGIPREELSRLVDYDIGGINIAKSGLTVNECATVDRWNRCWTGIQLRHYESCSNRARRDGKPGVVVVALGSNKARILVDAVVRGLVNCLFVDDDLGEAVLRECET